MLCRICRFSHTEHNKIGFAIFGFFYDFMSIYKLLLKHSEGKESFRAQTLGKI
jgi:hypothetical protein